LFKQDTDESQLIDKVVHINRVAKVVKGGRRFSFSAIVVVGDGNGSIGYGLGKAGEVPEAIRKGIEKAKKNMIKVSLIDGTIPFEVIGKFGAGKVFLKPCLTPPPERLLCPFVPLPAVLPLPEPTPRPGRFRDFRDPIAGDNSLSLIYLLLGLH